MELAQLRHMAHYQRMDGKMVTEWGYSNTTLRERGEIRMWREEKG